MVKLGQHRRATRYLATADTGLEMISHPFRPPLPSIRDL
jgi:hypothetical protein